MILGIPSIFEIRYSKFYSSKVTGTGKKGGYLKEASLHRMNFLKHGGGRFTYRSFVYGLAAWCVFLAMLYGIQFLRYLDVKGDIKDTKMQVAKFNEEKDRQIDLVKELGRTRVGTNATGDIASIIGNRPRWSKILRGFTHALPPDVWFDIMGVTGGDEEWYVLEMKGRAKSQRSLTNFIMKLESSGLFMKTALDNTKQAGDGTGNIIYELRTQPVMEKLFQDA